MTNYKSIIEQTDTSSIASTPALSVFSEIGASLDEARPLLTNTTVNSSLCHGDIVIDEEEPSATIASASINLSNTILGTGMLAMVSNLVFCLSVCIIHSLL